MEKSFFWAFFIIALVVGISLGFSVNNTVITGMLGQDLPFEILRVWDSDGGVNVEVQGFCRGADGETFIDVCLNEDTLIEYQLNFNNLCSPVYFNCPQGGYANGCQFGSCINGEPIK